MIRFIREINKEDNCRERGRLGASACLEEITGQSSQGELALQRPNGAPAHSRRLGRDHRIRASVSPSSQPAGELLASMAWSPRQPMTSLRSMMNGDFSVVSIANLRYAHGAVIDYLVVPKRLPDQNTEAHDHRHRGPAGGRRRGETLRTLSCT
jgi:hypothetical protein